MFLFSSLFLWPLSLIFFIITYSKPEQLSGTTLGYRMDYIDFESRQGLGIILFTTASRPTLRPNQPPIQRVPGALSLEVKWRGREADHSTPSSTQDKNAWSYTSTPLVRLHGMVLSQSTGTTSPYYNLFSSVLVYCFLSLRLFFKACASYDSYSLLSANFLTFIS
jgi:hypothetical protein